MSRKDELYEEWHGLFEEMWSTEHGRLDTALQMLYHRMDASDLRQCIDEWRKLLAEEAREAA